MRSQTGVSAIGFPAFLLMVLILFGCALFKKKEAQTGVDHQIYTVRFTGYKTVVKVKASPQEVEQYLFDPKIAGVKEGSYEIVLLTKNRIEKLGDRGSYKIKLPGISVACNGVLAYYKPGQEVWYLGQMESKQFGTEAMAIIRFNLSKLGDETRLVERWELETNELSGAIMDVGNVREIGGKLFDRAVAQGQVHFDPSLTVEGLLAEGRRGELYDAFYQAHQLGILINASPKKAAEYLKDPRHWKFQQDGDEIDFGGCLAKGDPGPCKIHLKTFGRKEEMDLFTGVYKAGEHTSAYWVTESGLTRMQVLIKPERNGIRLSFIYMKEIPFPVFQESELMGKIMQMPKNLEQMLINFKNELEGIG